MSKYISIPQALEDFLDKECPKNEEGKREENEGKQIMRLLKIK